MKRIQLIFPVLLVVFFTLMSCGNSSTQTTTKDTADKKDTIDRSSGNFSNPH